MFKHCLKLNIFNMRRIARFSTIMLKKHDAFRAWLEKKHFVSTRLIINLGELSNQARPSKILDVCFAGNSLTSKPASQEFFST